MELTVDVNCASASKTVISKREPVASNSCLQEQRVEVTSHCYEFSSERPIYIIPSQAFFSAE